MEQVFFRDLGLIGYQQAWEYQEQLFNEVTGIKLANRDNSSGNLLPVKHYLLFCEHPHVYTLGKSGSQKNLLIDEQGLKNKEATFFHINRGGDITYHGPGQIVGYPILDLDHFFTDIHRYLRFLEEAVILTLEEYGIRSGRIIGCTGVWIDADNSLLARKICAMGVRCSRWVTMHGFAFNVNCDMNYFDHIIPCGIRDKKVTSLHIELGKPVEISEVKTKLKKHLAALFGMELITQHEHKEKIV